MPELPEVETVKRGLKRLLVGHEIKALDVLRDKSYPNDLVSTGKFVIGAKVIDVWRRAKLILIELDTNYTLIVHLKMTGQLVYRSESKQSFGAGHPTDSLVDELPDSSTRVIIRLDKAKLFFNDQRVFGWMKLYPTPEIEYLELISKLGPEPLSSAFTDEIFIQQTAKRKKSKIKPVLLDQRVLAGVGNIYADEALWAAGIHPETRVEDIDNKRIALLREKIIFVLNLGIEMGGSTDKNYLDAEGRRGSYLEFAKVFRREGKPCERCGAIIQKIRVGGRGTHICTTCQQQ